MQLFFLAFQKSVLSYLAYLKIELNKMSDTQQEILQMLSNLPNNHFNDKTIFVDEEIDYFISEWPLQNHESLENMESKMRSDSNFRNKVVKFFIYFYVVFFSIYIVLS